MKVLTEEGCAEWLQSNVAAAELLHVGYPFQIRFAIPKDTGRKTALARELTAVMHDRILMLWVTEWSVFPSCENLDLFYGYRRFLGEARTLTEAPGHVFEKHERTQAFSLFSLALYFFWDASLINDQGSWVSVDHDEFLTLRSTTDVGLRHLLDGIDRFNLRAI